MSPRAFAVLAASLFAIVLVVVAMAPVSRSGVLPGAPLELPIGFETTCITGVASVDTAAWIPAQLDSLRLTSEPFRPGRTPSFVVRNAAGHVAYWVWWRAIAGDTVELVTLHGTRVRLHGSEAMAGRMFYDDSVTVGSALLARVRNVPLESGMRARRERCELWPPPAS
jgi:hypothetical protein